MWRRGDAFGTVGLPQSRTPLLHIFALMLNQLVKGRFDGSAAKPQWTVANDDGFGGTVTIEPDDSGVPSDRSIEIDYTRENVWIRSVFWDGMDKDDFDGKKLWGAQSSG